MADLSNTQLSRRLIAETDASQVVDIVRSVGSPAALDRLLRNGRIKVGLYIPPDFVRRVEQGGRPAAQLLVDGSDPTLYGVVQGLAGLTLPPRARAQPPPAPLFSIRNYYNPERRSAVAIIPALIGVILTMTMVLFTSISPSRACRPSRSGWVTSCP